MISPISNSLPPAPLSSGVAFGPAKTVSGPSFADVLRSAVHEASRAHGDSAVELLELGKVDGAMGAGEKAELALKALLAIRDKLMSAYEEIRNMPI